MRGVLISRGKRLETTYINLKNENMSHGLDFQKRKLKEFMVKASQQSSDLLGVDNDLKRVMNKYYDEVIENRSKFESYLEEKQRLAEVLNSNTASSSRRDRDNSRDSANEKSHVHHHSNSEAHKQAAPSGKEAAILHKYIFDLRDVFYLLIPELVDKVKTALNMKANASHKSNITAKSRSKLSRHGKTSGLIPRHSLRETLRVAPGENDGGKEAETKHAEDDHQDEKQSFESANTKKSHKEIEIEQILNYFGEDITAIPELILTDLDLRQQLYIEKRFQLLSVYNMVQYKKDLLKHYHTRLAEAIDLDETDLLQKIADTKTKIKDFEVDLHLRLEKLELENSFIQYRTESYIKHYISIK